MADKPQKTIPLPVQHAHAALELLRAENTALAESIKSILPAFAMNLDKQGIQTTPELLLDHARKELKYLTALRENAAAKELTYESIGARLRTPKTKTEYLWKEFKARSKNAEPHHHFWYAIMNGKLDLAKELLEKHSFETLSRHHYDTFEKSFREKQFESVRFLVDVSYPLPLDFVEKVFWMAAAYGQADIMREVHDKYHTDIKNEKFCNDSNIKAAVNSQSKDAVRYLMKLGVDMTKQDAGDFLWDLIRDDGLEMLKFVIEECGVPKDGLIHPCEHTRSQYYYCKDPDFLAYLVDRCGVALETITKGLDESPQHKMLRDLQEGHYQVVNFLLSKGDSLPANIAENSLYQHNYAAHVTRWKNIARQTPPSKGVAQYDPYLFRPKPFYDIRAWLKNESRMTAGYFMDVPAFQTAALFGTTGRVLEYFDRWGKNVKQPLHDLVQGLKIPESGNVNLKDWADAIIKQGPAMAKLFAFADRMPSPQKSADGKIWSLTRTREEAAKFIYKNGTKNPELAALCIELHVSEKTFDKALALVDKAAKQKNLPEITLNGQKFNMKGGRFYRLPANDARGLFLGKITDCCQSVGGAGESCAIDGFTSENSGFYVVENAKGDIIGETWAWRGKKGEMTFDSLETLGTNINPAQWKKILQEVARELTEKKAEHDVTALTVGTGGDTPETLLKVFSKVAKPAEPLSYKGYSDAENQFMVWQMDSRAFFINLDSQVPADVIHCS